MGVYSKYIRERACRSSPLQGVSKFVVAQFKCCAGGSEVMKFVSRKDL